MNSIFTWYIQFKIVFGGLCSIKKLINTVLNHFIFKKQINIKSIDDNLIVLLLIVDLKNRSFDL